MKNSYLLLLLVLLVSCGGGGGGGGSGSSIPTPNRSESPIIAKHQAEINCLEKELGWIANPPANKIDVFDKMADSKFENCASNEIMDLYMERVKLAHPNLLF